MKILQLVLALIAVFPLALGCWDCHRDCSGYDTCVEENRARGCRRELEADVETNFDADMWFGESDTAALNMTPFTNLRGSDRQLDTFHFQIKMHWKSNYCWQEEKRERKWCWECRGRCSSGNKVEIEKCDSGDSKQRWVYKDASGDYVRISPRSNQGLCLERDGGKMRLKSCDSSEDRQLLKGLKKNGDKFEFVPKGKDGYVLSQAHDPKSEEEIELIKKSTARGDHTNYWVVYNPSTSGSSGGGGGGGGGNGPAYKFKGSDWCSPNNKCGLCEGDCDKDADCEGNLVCKQRDENDKIDGCSGGTGDSSASDYCVPK